MGHYETLGVDSKATPDEIKKAYRAKAKQVHPDKGGRQSDFEPVVHAYEVLSNPERRFLYDTTGQDKRADFDTEVQSVLLQVFNQVFSAGSDGPIVEKVRQQIKDNKAKMPKMVKDLKAKKKMLDKRRSSITSKNSQNVAHMIIDGELRNIDGQLANLEHQMKIGKACLDALKSYSEDWEEPEPQVSTYQYFVRY